MKPKTFETSFEKLNAAYNSVFAPGRLSIGLVVPIESYPDGPVPSMNEHLERVQLAEELGFSSVWLRDVPFNVPSFGDAGQLFDPFVYLGALAAQTHRIGLGVASIILPLRHPAHVAKAAASVDALSGGRLLLGIASGDRPEEYPALATSFEDRGKAFRESYAYIRKIADNRPSFESAYGRVAGGIDMLPKPTAQRIPLLVTGSSRQEIDWIATNGDGWMTYPRHRNFQVSIIEQLRMRTEAAGQPNKPVMEPLYIDLLPDADAPPAPIHLGLRAGINALRDYLRARKYIGVNHIALNLRFNRHDTESTLKTLANGLFSEFSS
ncbi:MAG: LLM class oxidoreductase [Myxococcota bacterium]